MYQAMVGAIQVVGPELATGVVEQVVREVEEEVAAEEEAVSWMCGCPKKGDEGLPHAVVAPLQMLNFVI